MADTAEIKFDTIYNAAENGDGLLELPLLVLEDQVLFPQMLSMVPIDNDANLEAVRYAQSHHQTLIAVKSNSNENCSALTENIHAVGTEIAPGQIKDSVDNVRSVDGSGTASRTNRRN